MAREANVDEAQAQLDVLIAQVLAGEQVVITRGGRAVVDLVAHASGPVVFGGLREKIRFDQTRFDAADREIADMFGLAALS